MLLITESHQGNDGFILANDQDQAGDDLSLAKKLVAANASEIAEVEILSTEIKRLRPAAPMACLQARNARLRRYASKSASVTLGVKEAPRDLEGAARLVEGLGGAFCVF